MMASKIFLRYTGLRLIKKEGFAEYATTSKHLADCNSRKENIKRQNELFNAHKTRLIAENVPRIEKIEVQFKGRNIADDAVMMMNNKLSTPCQCAMHISNHVAENSVLALVRKADLPEHEDGVVVSVKNTEDEDNQSCEMTVIEKQGTRWIPWDMHRSLEYDCELKLLGFAMSQPSQWETQQVNKAYWKSCALILGAVAQEAFNDNLIVNLVNQPNIPEECGAFCYDIKLDPSLVNKDGSPKWQPDHSALISLTKTARHILSQNLQFERLVVPKEVAEEIFFRNEYQLKAMHDSVFTSVPLHQVPLYRFGEYIDICDGPLMPNTNTMYHYVVSAVHHLREAKAKKSKSSIWRFQGVSLPKKSQVHHAIWATLEHRARKLVTKNLPFEVSQSRSHGVDIPLHKYRPIEDETKEFNTGTGQWLQDAWKSSSDKLNIQT